MFKQSFLYQFTIHPFILYVRLNYFYSKVNKNFKFSLVNMLVKNLNKYYHLKKLYVKNKNNNNNK